MDYEAFMPYAFWIVIGAGFAALAYYWRTHPIIMLYHETGLPSTVGIVTSVHPDKARFKTLDEAMRETARLLNAGYCMVLVSIGRNGFMFHKPYDSKAYTLHLKGDAVEMRTRLLGMVPRGHTIAIGEITAAGN